MEKINLKRLLFYSFLSIVSIMGLSAYSASLVIPDSSFLIENPILHSTIAWLVFGVIAGLTIIVLYFLVDLAIDKEVLDSKITELETELNRLRKS